MTLSVPENPPPPDPLSPWTVMIKYLRNLNVTPLFFITEIEADSAEEAIAEVLSLGYSLPKDTFELTAKRVPIISLETIKEQQEKQNVPKNEPVRVKETGTRIIIRPQANRK